MFSNRKSCFKLPPATATSQTLSQELRRNKALAEQKRRRAQKVDLSRHLDLFAGLNLGPSDDEDEPISPVSLNGTADGVAKFVPLMQSGVAENGSENMVTVDSSRKRGSKKGRAKHKRRMAGESSRSTKWAGRCMYAELLEMKDVDEWLISLDGSIDDGLPQDLETGWVAVAPVPKGKRCLAVTYQSSGLAGTVSNTALRSRVQGKSLIPPFPSSLPPSTILDCILDENWRDNGILHVLDIIQYKGQNVGDCETAFRFWWRDTRLAELPRLPPPSNIHQAVTKSQNTPDSYLPPPTHHTQSTSNTEFEARSYRFLFPNTLLPVPYHTDTTLRHLSSYVIPLARSSRPVPIEIPIPLQDDSSDASARMDTDTDVSSSTTRLVRQVVNVSADGLLLYVAQASYEPGTSPLSSWIPVFGQERHPNHSLDLFERLVSQRSTRMQHNLLTVAEMDIEPSQEQSIS